MDEQTHSRVGYPKSIPCNGWLKQEKVQNTGFLTVSHRACEAVWEIGQTIFFPISDQYWEMMIGKLRQPTAQTICTAVEASSYKQPYLLVPPGCEK